nr:tetratricopeptide repeat protein [Actinomycetota bacterium]
GELTGLGARRAVSYIDLSPLEDDAAEELLSRLIGDDRGLAEADAVRSLLAACAGLPIALCVTGSLIAARPRRGIARLVAELGDERRRLAALSLDDDLSITAVFNMAYRGLTPFAQRCYRIVGTHPGDGDFGVAAVLAAFEAPEREVGTGLDELVAAGLLTEIDDGRYLPHTLIRLHARELATESAAEIERALRGVLRYYRDRAVVAGHAMMPGRGWLAMFFAGDLVGSPPAEPAAWMATERVNLLAVVEALFGDERLLDVCVLAIALWPLHEREKYVDDLVAVNERAVTAAQRLDRPDLVALATVQLGFGALHGGDARRAHAVFDTAVEAAERSGITELIGTAVEATGLAAVAAGDLAAAETLLRRNLAFAVTIGDPRRLALARLHLAKAVSPEESEKLLRQSSIGFLGLDPVDDYNAAKVALWLGRTLTRLRRFEEADGCLAEALAVMRAEVKPFDEAQILEATGELDLERGKSHDAVLRFQESLALFDAGGFMGDVRRVREKLAATG